MTDKKILLYVIKSDKDSNIDNLRKTFDTKLFDIRTVTVENNDKIFDTYTQILKDNRENKLILFIRDSTISNISMESMNDHIRSALKRDDWDICYLCRWMDNCSLHTDLTDVENHNSRIVRTHKPNGLHAFLINKNGADILLGEVNMKDGKKFAHKNIALGLNNEIYNGNIKAIAFTPNIVHFDHRKAEKDSDYMRCVECRNPQIYKDRDDPKTGNDGNNAMNTFWIFLTVLVICILVIMLIWILTRYVDRPISHYVLPK